MTLRDGVGAAEADVIGPVEPGVSLWSARWPDGNVLDYLVVPEMSATTTCSRAS